MIEHETQPQQQKIIYGAFKGMGDLLSAAPVIASQLDLGHRVWLLCFPGENMARLISLIEFGKSRNNLTVLILPVGSSWSCNKIFFQVAPTLDPDLIWISPHASRSASSWKVPLFLWTFKRLLWRKALLAGAASEHLSFLFDVKVAVDRKLPLISRELQAFALLSRHGLPTERKIAFIDRVAAAKAKPARYDLLIHPGATAQNRCWPVSHYAALVDLIPSSCRIAVLGLPSDVKALLKALPTDRNIQYLSGNFEEALIHIAQSRVVLTMDSGNAHFANVLRTPGIALFGKTDPATVLPANGTILPIYQPSFHCQPCQRLKCNQPQLFCMNSILPSTVAAALLQILAS